MRINNYFFQREDFSYSDELGVFYSYKGYYLKDENNNEPWYPLAFYFGKNEIVILVREKDGRANRLLTLNVNHGEQNQEKLTERIQYYWQQPLLKIKRVTESLIVNKELLSMSYFSSWNEFDIKEDRFKECIFFYRKNFRNKLRRVFYKPEDLYNATIKDYREITFHLNNYNNTYTYNVKDKSDKWGFSKDNTIFSTSVNLRKVLLDFIYELDFTSTFDDDKLNSLLPVIRENKLFDAIAKRCKYLDSLYRMKEEEINGVLPKVFLDAEKAWLNVCINPLYDCLFATINSVFKTNEEEASEASFYALIGKSKIEREKLFKPISNMSICALLKLKKKDILNNNSMYNSHLINLMATFFLRKYAIINAFKITINKQFTWIFPLILFTIPFADFICAYYAKSSNIYGITIIYLPCFLFVSLFVYSWLFKLNLFKLFFPRMFLGILLGWMIFASASDLWKMALLLKPKEILVMNIVVSVIVCIYVFTEIRSKLARVKNRVVVFRSVMIILIASAISLMQGFYMMQLLSKPVLENSGITKTITKTIVDMKFDEIYPIEKLNDINANDKASAHCYSNDFLHGIRNYSSFKLTSPWHLYDYKIKYIWSILLSQCVIAILMGLVLQLIWDDRQLTEPL